jgi:hypothetical protein
MGSGLFAVRRSFHRSNYAVAGREQLEVEVKNIWGKEVGEI